MKTIFVRTLLSVAAITAFVFQSRAIEGLKLSVQCADVVLSWPCLDDGSESFIIQYRATFSNTDQWQTLETSLPSVLGTNMMYYVHSNVVRFPVCNGGSFSMMSAQMSSEFVADTDTLGSIPLAVRNNGSGDAAPVTLYPTGFDFSDFSILDPVTGETSAGSGYTFSPLGSGSMSADGIDPNGDPAPDGGGTPVTPDTGFYRVVRVGAHLFGMTNGTSVSGVVNIPVEVGNDAGTLTSLSIVEDGAPVSDISTTYSLLGVLQVPVDTAQMTVGAHDIFAHATWQVVTGTNEGDFYTVEADSPPVTVNVYNEISFTNWMSSFGELGNQLLVSAQSAHTNVDWTVDVYGANAGYIGTFGGHSDDGSIYFTWDLVGPPPTNIVYSNEPWFDFKVSTPYADPPVRTYRQTDPWAGKGDWVYAAQHYWDNIAGHEDLYNELDGYIGDSQGFGLAVRPSPDSNGHPFGLRVGEQSDPNPTYDWTALRQALYDPHSRNFMYVGHGEGDGIGHNPDHTNRFIFASEIASVLHTVPDGQTNRHAFRLVIIDGCSTATGTLPEAFGIPHKEGMTMQDFLLAAMRPHTFVGWSSDKYINIAGGGLNYDHIHFIQHIPEGMLLNGLGIKDAIEYARTRSDVTDVYVNGKQFKVLGAQDIGFNSFNNQ